MKLRMKVIDLELDVSYKSEQQSALEMESMVAPDYTLMLKLGFER